MAKGYKKIDLQSLPACVAEFIRLVIKKMRYRKKVQADVQAELAAHFEDELKECANDKERDEKARRLIEDFGDVKLLGILLRRAKKRCRPLWRTVFARACQTVVVLFICFIVYLVWFLTGKPIVTVDYVAELNRMVRPAADENLNAGPLYEKAVELYNVKSSNEILKLVGTKYNGATLEQKKLIDKWLTDNRQIFDLIIAGTQKPYYWRKYANEQNTGEMILILMPNLAKFRELAYALRWRIWLSVDQGRYEEAFGDIKECYRLGRHLRGDKSLIEQLVGIAIEALAAQTIRDILSEHEIDPAILAMLQKDFEQIIADENRTVSFKFERLSIYDEIQRCFTAGPKGHIIPKRLTSLESIWDGPHPKNYFEELVFVFSDLQVFKDVTNMLFLHPNKRQSREMADRLYAFWDKMARKSPAKIRAENIDIEEQTMELIEGNMLLEILTPALSRIYELAHRNKIDVEATLPVIAILRYKQDVGDYPENLDELIEAGLLKALPIDPYSDQPLVYKKTDNNFVLYGVGENFKDDDGTVAVVDGRPRKWGTKEEGDWVFWPVDQN